MGKSAISQSYSSSCSDQSLWEEWLGHEIVTILTNIVNLEIYFNLKSHLNMTKNYLQKARHYRPATEPAPIMLGFPSLSESSHSQCYHSPVAETV